ncbi:MAG: MFS transporter [Caulobacteraceae bacterium]
MVFPIADVQTVDWRTGSPAGKGSSSLTMPTDLPAGLDPVPVSEMAAAPRYISRRDPAYRRASLALVLAGFSTFSLLYCVQPLLPVLAGAFHVGATQSSLALSLSTGFLALSILLAGAVSETAGRKTLMAASLALAAVLNLAASVAPTWPLLLIARGLEGVALGGAPAVAMTWLSEEIDPKDLGFAMGLYVAGTALGGMTGRVVTGVVADLGGWRAALAAIGALGLLSAGGFVLLLPPSRNFIRQRDLTTGHHLRAWAGHLGDRDLPWVFAIGFLVMGGFVSVYNYAGFRLTAPPYALSQTAAGLIFLVYLFGMASSSVAGGLADRLGRAPVLIGGLAVFAAGLALTLLRPLAAVIGGVALVTVGFFIAHAVASGWVGRLARQSKGHATSLYLLAYYGGSSLLGSVGGWFWTGWRWPGVAAFVATTLVLALAAAIRLARAPHRLPISQPSH